MTEPVFTVDPQIMLGPTVEVLPAYERLLQEWARRENVDWSALCQALGEVQE